MWVDSCRPLLLLNNLKKNLTVQCCSSFFESFTTIRHPHWMMSKSKLKFEWSNKNKPLGICSVYVSLCVHSCMYVRMLIKPNLDKWSKCRKKNPFLPIWFHTHPLQNEDNFNNVQLATHILFFSFMTFLHV